MTATDPHAHELHAAPADDVMARLADVFAAFDALEHAALNIQCPGCDPDGDATEQARVALAERFDVDASVAVAVLDRAADVRGALLGLLAEPCGHGDGAGDEAGEGQ